MTWGGVLENWRGQRALDSGETVLSQGTGKGQTILETEVDTHLRFTEVSGELFSQLWVLRGPKWHQACAFVAECVCIGGVDRGLILGKSGDEAKAKNYFKASPARPAPHTAPLLSQAAAAWGPGQAWRVLFREELDTTEVTWHTGTK